MLSTANITMQFGAKPLFENVSVSFGNGNRYGLIGANGSGKSTLLEGIAVVADLYDDSLGDDPVTSYEGLIRWDVDRFVEALQ